MRAIGFRFGEANYVVIVEDGAAGRQRGEVIDCEVVFSGSPTRCRGRHSRRRAARNDPH